MATIGGFRSDLSITRKTDGNFGKVPFCFSKTEFNGYAITFEPSHASRLAHRLCNLFQNRSNPYSSLL